MIVRNNVTHSTLYCYVETVEQCEDLSSLALVLVIEAMANTSESPFSALRDFYSYLPPLCASTPDSGAGAASSGSASASASASASLLVSPTASESSVAESLNASGGASATHHKRPVAREVTIEELIPVANDACRHQQQLLHIDYLLNVYLRSSAEMARPSALVSVRDASSDQPVTTARPIAGM